MEYIATRRKEAEEYVSLVRDQVENRLASPRAEDGTSLALLSGSPRIRFRAELVY
jgi:hypothetical protein